MVFRVASVNGRRIFDIGHLFKQILNGKKHEPFECSIINMEILNEKINGLCSTFYLKCNFCNKIEVLTSDSEIGHEKNINSSVVLGAISTGIGYTQVNELASILNMPFVSPNTFNKYHEQVADFIRSSAWHSMEEAAAEEAKFAKENGDVDEHGIPCVTVVTDGAWGKRSYNVNYDSLSGVVSNVNSSNFR